MPSDLLYSQEVKEMPHSNSGKRVLPNSVAGNDGPRFGDVRPQHYSLNGVGGATGFDPMTYLPKQKVQMHQPLGDGTNFMYPPAIPVGLLQGQMLQSPQQAFHKLNNQIFSAPGTNTVTISEQHAQIGDLKGGIHPPLHEFWGRGQGGRHEIIEEIDFKPQSISNGNSRHSVHNFNTGMANATSTTTTTTTTTPTCSGRIVSVDHVIKDPVPSIRASNRSGVSGMKNYTMVCHPPGRHGGTSIAGAGAGGRVEISGRCDSGGGVGCAVVGSSEMVDMTASFQNFSCGTPRKVMESLVTVSPGEFIFIILLYSFIISNLFLLFTILFSFLSVNMYMCMYIMFTVFKFSAINFNDMEDIPVSLLQSIALCFRERMLVCRHCFFGKRDLSKEGKGQLCSTGEHNWSKPIFVIPGEY